jgi:hypothetical protein
MLQMPNCIRSALSVYNRDRAQASKSYRIMTVESHEKEEKISLIISLSNKARFCVILSVETSVKNLLSQLIKKLFFEHFAKGGGKKSILKMLF